VGLAPGVPVEVWIFHDPIQFLAGIMQGSSGIQAYQNLSGMGGLPQLAPLACMLAFTSLALSLPRLSRFLNGSLAHFVMAGALAGAGVATYVHTSGDWAGVGRCVLDYVSFMAVMVSLFVVSGGIYLEGAWAGTPASNMWVLVLGLLLANGLGSVGACMVLLRPLLRSNRGRRHVTHTLLFFIFIVGNGGGLLTALGNPPLTLGFLKGLPFFWTLRLWPEWAFLNGTLLLAYFCVETRFFRSEASDVRGASASKRGVQTSMHAVHLEGGLNVVFLGLILLVLCGTGLWLEPWVLGHGGLDRGSVHVGASVFQVFCLAGLSFVSFKLTPERVHILNRFSFEPLLELGAVFLGLFGAMLPVLALVSAKAPGLSLSSPWDYFWFSGWISSVLDNAPTYLLFVTLGLGKAGLAGASLSRLAAVSPKVLEAVTCGSVMMGALTYIGNAPNLLVRSMARHYGVKMPGFFRYMAWSFGVLVPLLFLVAVLFFY